MATIGVTLTTEQLDAIKDGIKITEVREADGTTYICYQTNNIYPDNMYRYFKIDTLALQTDDSASQEVKDVCIALDTNSTLEAVKTAVMDYVKEQEFVAKVVTSTRFPKV